MYLTTDEESEAVEALQFAARMTAEAATDERKWRWIVLSLHNAVQGFMVLSLRHGNGLLALSPSSYKAWMEAYKANRAPPPDRLDDFRSLYKKVKRAVGGNVPFTASPTTDENVRRLHDIRCEFIHFVPKGWSLDLNGLPMICMGCCSLISFLGWETNNIFWHQPELRDEARRAHDGLLNALAELNEQYRRAIYNS